MTACDKRRVIELNKKDIKNYPVVYLMSRDQRVNDNWALIFAKNLSEEIKQPLKVVFFLSSYLENLPLRQYDFMTIGLWEVEKELQKLNIPFYFLLKDSLFFEKEKIGAVVTDFNPLKEKAREQKRLLRNIKCKAFEVDAHNIVPCFLTSNKQEFAAYTIRPKIKKLLPDFLTSFPKIKKQEKIETVKVHWDEVKSPLGWIKSGERESKKALNHFINNRLKNYYQDRNNPTLNGQSNLSPYIRFGQISAQRIANSVSKSEANSVNKDAFLEELIVRKELSDNFCYYCKDYDNFNGFPSWAKDTLNKHRRDKREYLYSLKDFESANTHDNLWNAAQTEMVKRGKMNGYLRMYWAKKILEWSSSPESAMKIALKLNNKYELDGYDSRGYTGVAWSIGGVHDRAWGERPIFGKIRYMSYGGSKSKFKIKEYIEKVK